jgi:Predicted transcriptional regulator with C-terminal CBS domains
MSARQLIGTKAKEMRKQSAQTQKRLSEVTGLPQSTLSEIENGRFTGSLDIMERYLDVLGLQLTVVEKAQRLPDWDELDTLFEDT